MKKMQVDFYVFSYAYNYDARDTGTAGCRKCLMGFRLFVFSSRGDLQELFFLLTE